jgi:hypothetical protein
MASAGFLRGKEIEREIGASKGAKWKKWDWRAICKMYG